MKKLMKELVLTLETKTCQMWLGKEKKISEKIINVFN